MLLALLVLALATLAQAAAMRASEGYRTDDPPYAAPVAASGSLTALLTVGEVVTRTSGGSFRMVGMPDGMGAYTDGTGNVHLLVNHELDRGAVTRPVVGGTPQNGSFVSEFVLDPATREILSGDLAYTTVYSTTNPSPLTGAFGRFCSGTMAGSATGFDRPIYFTGEEASGSGTFDGRGGQAVAVLDGAIYLLPDLGRYSKENIVPAPLTGDTTVVFGTEDGPSSLNSQLYMYVGSKNPSAAHPLLRNGLAGGQLYVFGSASAGHTDEATFHKADGTINGRWIPLPDGASLSEAALDATAIAAGSFNFIRLEDGSAPPSRPGHFFFTTTGSSDPANPKGRLYELTFDPAKPTVGATTLRVLAEGAAGDPIVNPDNMDINAAGVILVQEDPNGENRGAALGRDASIFAYNTSGATITRVAEIDQSAVPTDTRAAWGTWESSGIIDASPWLGPNSWLFGVQAHSVSSLRASQLQGSSSDLGVAQGGQLLLLTTVAPTALDLTALAVGPTAPRFPAGMLLVSSLLSLSALRLTCGSRGRRA